MLLSLLLAACVREPVIYPGPDLSTAPTDTAAATGTGTGSGTATGTPTGGTGTPTGTSTGTATGTGTGTATGSTTDALIAFDGPRPRNILFWSIDTLRRDLFVRHGGKSNMPWMEGLMAEGVVFDDVQQCSNWTGAGTSCTMSGRHGVDAGFEPLLSAREGDDFVPDDSVFMAEVLRDEGWHTILYSTNGWLRTVWGNTQGFDVNVHMGGARAFGVLEAARQTVLEAPADLPWYTHLHFYDPHAPYNPPEEYLGELEGREELPWDLANRPEHYEGRDLYHSLDADTQLELKTQLIIRYEAEVRFMDDRMAEQWVLWDEAGLLDDTLVVFWADHGEAFWEHGRQTHAWHLFEEENSVAMFLWSKNIKPNSYAGPVSTIDLMPTLLDLYEVDVPEEATGLLIPDQITDDRVRYAMANAREGVVQSVTRGTQRIMFYWRSGEVVVTDSAVDPDERLDLYDPEDALTLELWELLKPRVEQADANLDTVRWPITWPADLPR
ncbi:MAG: arylsulfatase [Myxococcota bacterium]|jgi:arylsulfatase